VVEDFEAFSRLSKGDGHPWLCEYSKAFKNYGLVLEVNNNTPEYRTLKPYLLASYSDRTKAALWIYGLGQLPALKLESCPS